MLLNIHFTQVIVAAIGLLGVTARLDTSNPTLLVPEIAPPLVINNPQTANTQCSFCRDEGKRFCFSKTMGPRCCNQLLYSDYFPLDNFLAHKMDPFTWFTAVTSKDPLSGGGLSEKLLRWILEREGKPGGATAAASKYFKLADLDRNGIVTGTELAQWIFNWVDTGKNERIELKEAFEAVSKVSQNLGMPLKSDWQPTL